VEKKELASFRANLLAWFREFQRDLPWRRTRDPYRIWLSEIMLQQTRVAAVVPYFEKFLERFPDVRSLAEAPQEEVLRLWSGLGYYTRARNLQRAAQIIVVKHGGEFPRELDAALALPGIGAYTAAAILSIAYGEKLAVLDGNVARVLARIEAVRGDLREGTRWKELQSGASRLLSPESPGDWNQAMMELGATLCTPRAPQCLLCPVATYCRARKLGLAEDIPQRRKKREAVRVALVAAVFLTPKGETLLLPPAKSRGNSAGDIPTLVSGMWHFPTQSIEGDSAKALRALLRSISGGKGAGQQPPVALGQVKHAVTYRRIVVLPYLIAVRRLPRKHGWRGLALAEVPALPISNLTRKIARAAQNTVPQ
jgi:A/G-specific adenine glycosylase